MLFSVEVTTQKKNSCLLLDFYFHMTVPESLCYRTINAINRSFFTITLLWGSVFVGVQLLSQPAGTSLRITAERKNYIYASLASHLGHNKYDSCDNRLSVLTRRKEHVKTSQFRCSPKIW